MTFPSDVITFRTIILVDKIFIILLVLLHHAHGDVVELTDLLITPSGEWTPNTIAPQLIMCVTPDILKQTKWHQVDAVYVH